MVTQAEVIDCLIQTCRKWLFVSSAVPLVRIVNFHDQATQNAPTGEAVYLTVGITEQLKKNWYEVKSQVPDGMILMREDWHYTLDINGHGNGAYNALSQAHADIDTPLYWERIFQAMNISVIDIGRVTSLTTIRGKEINQRALCRIVLGAANFRTQDMDQFNKLSGEIDVYESSDSIEKTTLDLDIQP